MILTSLIILPLAVSAVFLFMPEKWVRPASIGLSFLYFFYSLSLFYFFDGSHSGIQLSEKIEWFSILGIHYFLGIDGISFWLVLLTSFLFPLTVLGSALSVKNKFRGFISCLFLLTGIVQGSFLALDACLFYIFFESSLLPLFFLILIWGGENRVYASFKFFIYTALGSLFMLVGFLTLMFMAKEQLGFFSTNILDFYQLKIPFVSNYILSPQALLFFAFFIAFAVKTPCFPFHTWLPLAHVEAPTAGSIFLAAVVLKMGAYGFLRFIFPLFPEASLYYSPFVCFISVIGIIYGALMALAQKDIKKLIAYSSVSHMGYVTLGFFVFNSYALAGGYFQMLTHGLSSAGLFALVGLIYQRTHTRDIRHYGGVALKAPIYSVLFFLVSLSAIALPLTGGFVSEFMVLFGTFIADFKWALFAVCGVVLGAVYMLFLILKVFFGPAQEKTLQISDVSLKEILIVAPIVILIFFTGLFPNAILRYSQASLSYLLENRFNYQLSVSNENKLSLQVRHSREFFDTLTIENTASLSTTSLLRKDRDTLPVLKATRVAFNPAKAGISSFPQFFNALTIENTWIRHSHKSFVPASTLIQQVRHFHEPSNTIPQIRYSNLLEKNLKKVIYEAYFY